MQLQSIQNIAARLVTLTPKYDHISPVLRRLHWLPISARIEFKVICLTFRIINGLAPAYMRELVCLKKPQDPSDLQIKCSLTFQKPGLKCMVIVLFQPHGCGMNSLSRRENNLTKLKKSLKTFLFKRAYGI